MVDVVFQLMTFMLFSMKLVSPENVNMPEARHGIGVEENAATFVLVAPGPTPTSKPKMLVGLKGDQGASMDEVVSAVSKGVAEGKRKVVLQADGSIPHGEVVGIISEIAKRESGVTIHLGVREPE